MSGQVVEKDLLLRAEHGGTGISHQPIKTFIAIACGISLVVLSAPAVPLQLHSQIDSSISPSSSAGGDSALPVTSPDGRFILFASTANNLALATSNTPYGLPVYRGCNVFLRDRASNTTVLVSVSLDGTSGADRDALPTGISTNGQFALFESAADNLATGGTNTVRKVLLRDVINGTNFLISVKTNGINGNGDSYSSVMTPDGRYVAFTSAASDLVPDDTNGIPDVFVCDVQSGTTSLASPGAISTQMIFDSMSDSPVITPDGRYVAFFSSATNLVPGQTLAGDIYVRDFVTGTTTWASAQARSLFQSVTGITNAISCAPCISDDGNYVAFISCTNALGSFASAGMVFRYNCASGQTDLVNTNSYVTGFETCEELDMTPDGRFIALVADMAGTAGTNTAIYLWDGQNATSTLVSANTNNALPALAFCDSPQVSSNGQFVVFLSTAASLATNASGTNAHLYRRDVLAGSTVLVNAGTNGVSAGDESILGLCQTPDGQFVAFGSSASGLTLNDGNAASDVFLRDIGSGTTELISARQPLLPSFTGGGLSTFSTQPLSQDGHYLAFASGADNLVPGDTNGMRDVFVRDLYQGTTVLASAGLNGAGASGMSDEPVISGNGRFVAFTSAATNLIAMKNQSYPPEVFVRDLQANTTSLVSVNSTGTGEGNAASYTPTISSDGRFVLFLSTATSLAAGSYGSGTENLFLRDQQRGVTYALKSAGQAAFSMTPDGHYVAFTDTAGATAGRIYLWDSQLAQRVATNSGTTYIQKISISPDGNRIARVAGTGTASLSEFDRAANSTWLVGSGIPVSHPGLRFSADGSFLTYSSAPASPATNQVYLCNISLQTNVLVSHATGLAAPGDGASHSPDISADGRYVVYRSGADNLVAGDTNGVPDVFLFDATTGSNVILSASFHGSVAADNRSLAPIFSGDGRTLVFRSWGSDLMAGTFNQTANLFAYAFSYANANLTNGGGMAINWPTAPGQKFTVQYTDDLTTPTWQDYTGAITTNGNRAYLTDPASASAHRFYRVVSDQ